MALLARDYMSALGGKVRVIPDQPANSAAQHAT
jgi:hypothetical protein